MSAKGDIRSFFGGAPKPAKKPEGESGTAAAAAASSTAATASTKPTPTLPKKSTPTKSPAATKSEPIEIDADETTDPKKKKTKSVSKKKEKAAATGAADGTAAGEGEEKESSTKKKETKPKPVKTEKSPASSSVEVKSPHFPSKETKEKTPTAAAPTDSKQPQPKAVSKKRIREEDSDGEEVKVVEPAAETKQVVYRNEPSPKKPSKATGPTNASDFFSQQAKSIVKKEPDLQALKDKVEAKKKQQEKERLLAEQAKLEAELLEVEKMEDVEELTESTAPTITVTAPTPTNTEPTSASMEDISANWQHVSASDAQSVSDDDVEVIAKPPPKSPESKKSPDSSTPAKSPPAKKAKLEPTPSPKPAKSPLKESGAFTSFSPNDMPRPSLSANATYVHPSPKKAPTPSPSPPLSAKKSPSPPLAVSAPASAKKPTPPSPAKLTAAQRAVASSNTLPSTLPTTTTTMEEDFGGASLQTNYDSFNVDEDEVQESPAKKTKTNAGTAAPSTEKKKFNPYVPPPTPMNLGSKEIPVGKPNCLAGLTFVFTGQSDSFTREDALDIVKKYGGKVTSAISGKTNYVVAGTEPGESKMKKARELKTKIITEDDLLQMIRDKSKGWTPTTTSTTTTPAASSATTPNTSIKPPTTLTPAAAGVSLPKPGPAVALAQKGSAAEQAIKRSGVQTAASISDMLWVDAHRPLKVEAIIGNPGLVKRVKDWLSTWHQKRKEREQNMSPKDQEKAIKALLISGPPGIGKSTAATVIARSLGFEVIEFNASDTRNKKSLKEEVGDLTGNRGLTEFFTTKNNATPMPAKQNGKPSVIIMDEVDGIAGNEDRGGMQELVSIIKHTRTPIICIANDASSPKMKTLKNWTEHISWHRVPAAALAPKIQEICKKEGLEIDLPSISKIAESTQGDIRQILNFLQMFRKGANKVSFDDVKARIEKSGKDFDSSLGPFDVVPSLFRPIPPAPIGRHNDWIGDRTNLYFVDSDLIPLFIQENYPHGRPILQGLPELKSNASLVQRTRGMADGQTILNEVLTMSVMAEAAESISIADLIGDTMLSEQDYSLMPAHAVLSTIYPSYLMRGGLSGMVAFPQWLGKQSSRGKFMRIAREFKTALTLDIHADNKDIVLYVLPELRREWLHTLTTDTENGVDRVITELDHFGLDKEEFDLIMEWGEKMVPEDERFAAMVPSAVKSKLTRLWKAGSHLRKVTRLGKGSDDDIKRVRGSSAFAESTDDVGEDENEEDEEGEGEGEEKADAKEFEAKGKAKAKPKAASTKKTAAEKGPPKEKKPRKRKEAPAAAGSKKKKKGSDDEDDDDDF